MSQYNNSAKIFTGSGGGELRISLNNTKQVINATNNKAQYYAELAEKYKNEAKEHRDNAQYYAEQNSDVTFEYIDSVKESLENQIATKQNSGDYALKSDLPTKVSELHNDLEFTTFNAVIPNQQNQENKVLCTDGEKLFWNSNSSYNLFDIKTFDYVLNYEESKGWALQGTYVYKEAVAGSRYGYPDFYNKCLEEKESGVATEVTLGEKTITMYVNSNGHQFYDITDKYAVDVFFNTTGSAWFYGIDTENMRVFLPRNNYFAISGVADSTGVIGNGQVIGLTNSGNDSNLILKGQYGTGNVPFANYTGDRKLPTSDLGMGITNLNNIGLGLSPNPEHSGIIAVTSNVLELDDSKYLYICVGNTINYKGVTEIVNQSLEILEQINQGIETRVNLEATNLSSEGKSLVASFSMPSSKYIDIAIGANKATYTMPADGYLAFYGNAPNTSEGGSAGMKNLTLGNFAVDSLNIWGRRTACIMPVRKNDQVEINFSNAISIRLYLLEGNKGEL